MWTSNTTYDSKIIQRHIPAYRIENGKQVPINAVAKKRTENCEDDEHEAEEPDAMLLAKDEKFN